MEVSELMVGDWVLNTYHNKPMRVKEICADKIILEGQDRYKMEGFEPIPITREILEKNGFKKQHTLMGDEFVFTDKGDNACEILFFFEDDIHVNHMRVLSNTSSVERAVRNINVHELQHALRFCEIEKEIVL